MEKLDFSTSQKIQMVAWRKVNILTKEVFQSKNSKTGESITHSYIIPKNLWKETIWSGIRDDSKLQKYLRDNKIQAHTGTNNLVSSWVNCANLYFPIRENESLKHLMLEFLKQKISDSIVKIEEVELEFAFPEEDELSPTNLLGELGGSRGSGQTSPDVAFKVITKIGKGLVLTECKYTEHSFYGCSARKVDNKLVRINNPDPKRCMEIVMDSNYAAVCHQSVWGRKYLSLLEISEFGKNKLERCPAATAGYQLLRQQALAEGIAKSGRYSLVASTVAFDNRNTDLKGCLKTTGIDDFQTGWGELFTGKAVFKTWTHQEWVQFVRDNQLNGEFNDWLTYLNQRYGY
jgi:hypothetical protein